MYEVIDRQTKLRVGKTLKTRKSARNKADRLDMNYGAYRYYCREVEVQND